MTPSVRGRIDQLVALRAETANCERCDLSRGRTKVVFGDGNVDRPPVAFVGEAPGQTEDEEGRPFVGKAGRVLTEFIEYMGYKREHVYVVNTVMCRPPKNRQPQPAELQACNQYLETQLRVITPMTIVALGRTAASVLVGPQNLAVLRQRWHKSQFGLVRVTYHPAFILRNPGYRSAVYDDLRAVRGQIDSLSR